MVELMVGVAVGLFIVAGAIGVFAANLSSSHRLRVETRLNQDLRAAADLVARDLRRAGYWGNAVDGTVAIGTGAATPVNPYRQVDATSSSISYSFSREAPDADDDTLGADESFGFQLADGVLKMKRASGDPQPLTDPNVVRVTAFSIVPTVTSLPLGHLCTKICTAGTPNCPTVLVRRYDIVMRGEAVSDSTIQRELRNTVRVRNERMEGQCAV